MSLIKLIAEANSSIKTSGAFDQIIKFLSSKLGVLTRIPGFEEFKNSKNNGFGIRYVFDGTKMLRFNWHSIGSLGDASSIVSIDVWSGSKRDPFINIQSRTGESFTQLLPQLADAIAPRTVAEAKKGDFTKEAALRDFFSRLSKGKSLTRGDFAMLYHMENIDLFDTLVDKFASQITMVGKRVAAKRGVNWEQLANDVLHSSEESLLVTDAGQNETYADFEEPSAAVSFSTQLEHLSALVTGVAKGAFNALFVAGRGGTGKTQTVEAALQNAGLQDGAGYCKISGSATAVGIYSLMYKHFDEVLLFDDSDGALNDVDARNLIKAATDTKKRRKLAWTKSGAINSPDGKVPQSFFFEGRIIFISNLSLDKLDPDKSIRTRAFIIVIDPTNDEMLEHMRTILAKIPVDGIMSLKQREQVLEVVADLSKTQDINLRTLVRALNLCASGVPTWESLVRLYA